LEYRLPAAEGSWRWVRSTFQNQLDHPVIQGIVIHTQDITDWKVAEEQRRRIQRLETQIEVMGFLTSEFSNLWMGVQGHIDVSRLNGMEDEKLLGLQVLLSRASRMLHQMRDVCGHPMLERKPVDLNRLISEMVSIHNQSADGLSHRIHLDLATSLPLVEGDPELLGRLVGHLTDHIVGAMDGRPGTILVATYCTALSQEAVDRSFKAQGIESGGGFIVIEFLDPTGSFEGDLSPDGFDLVGDSGFSSRGLSMQAAYRTVWSHLGAVEVERMLGEGSRLRVFLPVPVGSPSFVKAAEADLQADSILVVDDEEYLLDATQSLLSHLGYHAITARGGKEALERLATLGPSIGLILLDLNMPFMDGEETYKAIRKVNPSVKIVLCTGSTSIGFEHDGVDAELAGILRKPYAFDDLSDLVRNLLPK
jgi:CheY-like chemotaxis protein